MQRAVCSTTQRQLKGACCPPKSAFSLPAAPRGHQQPSPQSRALSTCPACRWLQHTSHAVPPSLASVCLQLPEADRNLPYPPATEGDRGGTDPGGPAVNESRTTWRAKLRSLLCCLAPPSNDQYFRSSETEAVVIRPLQPPTPPRYTGAAVTQLSECCAEPGQQLC